MARLMAIVKGGVLEHIVSDTPLVITVVEYKDDNAKVPVVWPDGDVSQSYASPEDIAIAVSGAEELYFNALKEAQNGPDQDPDAGTPVITE